MIKAIVAFDDNYLIGGNDRLPWRIPEDLIRFKTLTSNNIVFMGRKTWESLSRKPLPDRLNVIISKTLKKDINNNYRENYIKNGLEGEVIVNSIEEALDVYNWINMNIMAHGYVIGGSEIYKQFLELDLIEQIDVTRVYGIYDGDVYFPKELINNWEWFAAGCGSIKCLKYDFFTLTKPNKLNIYSVVGSRDNSSIEFKIMARTENELIKLINQENLINYKIEMKVEDLKLPFALNQICSTII